MLQQRARLDPELLDEGLPSSRKAASASAYATCSDPLPGWGLHARFTTNDSAPFGYKRIDASQAACPSGKKLLGAGAEIGAGPGPAPAGEVLIDDLTPNSTLTGVSVTAWEDLDRTAANWSLNVWYVCANPVPGLELVASTSYLNSYSYKSATATCPKGKKVLSAGGDLTSGQGHGGDVTGGGGDAMMDSLRLTGGLGSAEGVSVVARKAGGGPSFNTGWYPHAYAICVTP